MSDERRAYNLEMAEAIGRIEAKVDALSGPEGRVTRIEDDMSRAETRQWLHSCIVLPIVGAAHVIAHKIGW